MSIETVRSADGTTIAYETVGTGPALVLIGGSFCDRRAPPSGTPLAALLADRFTVYSYDRRGRGDSTDRQPYATEREIDDLAAVVKAAGGEVFVFGNSSGSFIGLDAAAVGVAISKLACYEPPVILDASRASAMIGVASELAEASAANRRAEAVELYMTRVMQMPAPAFEQMRKSPMFGGLQALAHTLSYDLLFTARGPARLAVAASVRCPTLVMNGSASPPWMRKAIERLAGAIPGGRHRTLEGQTHAVDIAIIARALEEFFATD
jgi:pimeloyl-ACP methyl ester carboxylesterase